MITTLTVGRQIARQAGYLGRVRFLEELPNMKNMFSSYYAPTQEKIKSLWDECLFVLDTNILLDLYRYTLETRDELINILLKISERIWIPHQVGLEYFRNRPETFFTQENIYIKAKKLLNTLCSIAETNIQKDLKYRYHPFIDKKIFLEDINEALMNISKKFDENKAKHPTSIREDQVLEILTELFDGKVGEPCTEEELGEIYKQGKKRYENDIPPGYEDSRGKNKKTGNDIYGDLVIWFQCIDHAKKNQKPIIFITNDGKKDWWWEIKGRTLGPKIELIEEMMKEANVSFYMYNSDQFMKYAQKYLDITVRDESIKEARELRFAHQATKNLILEHQFTLEGIPRTITIRFYDDPDIGGVSFEQSHYIQTPLQIGPYRTSRPWNDNFDLAFHQALSGFKQYYNIAIKEGHVPSESWLVENERFKHDFSGDFDQSFH